MPRSRLPARDRPGRPEGRYIIDANGSTIEAPRGASDAFLAPYHIERGKLFVRHRCGNLEHLDSERIVRAIELTRFPIPADDDHAATDTEPALVRAADLLGQLGDPDHPRKINALYYEFPETGMARGRLPLAGRPRRAVPKFFWSKVEPYVGTAIEHLERTLEGKQWIAQLYAHVFVEEHGCPGRTRAGGGERIPTSDASACCLPIRVAEAALEDLAESSRGSPERTSMCRGTL